MLLHELAEATGVSAASIKYYRREGLLPPGERITTTRQDYGRAHVERLELIQVLREVAGAPIARIARVTALLDDPDVPLIEVLAESQTLALGLEDPADGAETAGGEHPSIAPLLAHLGWPDVDSAPRRALDRLLHSLEEWEAPTDLGMLLRYGEPMAQIARSDVDWMSTGAGPAGARPAGAEPSVSQDVAVMRAVAGAIAFDRLVRLLRLLGHASFSILDAMQVSEDSGPSGPPITRE
ncbi:MerR family transcriptional regulator [Brachybacterium paraconglomeratum]|uniref:MerR family transcriptional regulator n=1 Tax=Brachybacterium paraconglomeratum TaxID=173362 RepID=UPI0022E8E8E9|nr:MerR family transcriptional regulator [Brachybacterium paraconglomeratum]